MRYLAQVYRQDSESEKQLKLLAVQKAEYLWSLEIGKDNSIPCADLSGCEQEGRLVLIELSEDRTVTQVQSATDWVLELVEQYLSIGLSPAALQQEVQKAEQWRQSWTLRSQELDCKAVELEARRGQIEELEAKLIEEKKRFEAIANQLKSSAERRDNPSLEAVHSSDD
jgi:hypothetical protein